MCFDPTSGAVGEFAEGEALFDGEQPSEATKAVLQFCEQFETAGQRTAAFIQELKNSDLLMDGEVAIQPEGARSRSSIAGSAWSMKKSFVSFAVTSFAR